MNPDRTSLPTLARILAILLAAVPALPAGATQFRFERISLSDGLSQSSIQAMIQGPDDYLWIGTQFGVDRYDGYQVQSWRPGGDGGHALSHGFVGDMMFDRDGTLWIGTSDGLNRLDPATGLVHQYFPEAMARAGRELAISEGGLVEDAQGNVLAATSIGPVRWLRAQDRLERLKVTGVFDSPGASRLVRGEDDVIWMVSRQRLWRYRPSRGDFVAQAATRVGSEPRLGGSPISLATPASGGGLAWATPRGLMRVQRPNALPQQVVPDDPEFRDIPVDAVARDADNNLWLLAGNTIVRASGPGWQTWQRMLDEPLPESQSTTLAVLDLAETTDGRIWLGGQFGVAVLDPGAESLRLLKHRPNEPQSLPPSLAEVGYKLRVDRFGVLWVGTNLGGLARLAPQSHRFDHIRDMRPAQHSRNVVRAIVERRADGRDEIWVANQNVGVTVWERSARGEHHRIAEYVQGPDGGPLDTIRALAVDPFDQAIWLAGSGWLGRVDRAGDAIEFTASMPGTTRALIFGDAGSLWLGSGSWIIEYALDQARTPRPARRFSLPAVGDARPMEVFSLCHDSDDGLVVGGYGGLARIDPERGTVRRFLPGGPSGREPGNLVFDVHCAADGLVWFGTRGAGLGHGRLGATSTDFRFFDTIDGLSDPTVYAILPGPNDELWLSSNRGVMRFEPESGRVDRFGLDDGLQALEFNNTVAYIGASGRYYFGGIDGWNEFRPETIHRLPQAPTVHASFLRVADELMPVAPGATARLRLEHDRNRIEIGFVGLHFADPGAVRYAWRLAGLDEGWVDTGRDRTVRFASLPPGEYRFEVRAASPDGVWSEPTALLEADIAAPLWTTPAA